jgi:hypothetical protein
MKFKQRIGYQNISSKIMTKLLSNYRLLFSCLAVALPLGLAAGLSPSLLKQVQCIGEYDLLSKIILSGS